MPPNPQDKLPGPNANASGSSVDSSIERKNGSAQSDKKHMSSQHHNQSQRLTNVEHNGTPYLRHGQTTQHISSRNNPQQRARPFAISGTRTVWILSLCLSLTLCIQLILLVYHDTFVMQLDVWEKELLEEFYEIGDAVSNNDRGAANSGTSGKGIGTLNCTSGSCTPALSGNTNSRVVAFANVGQFGSFSMEPADILQRAGVDPSEGYIPPSTRKESLQREQAESQGVGSVQTKQQKHAQLAGVASAAVPVELPSVQEIQSLYGNRTRIVGLERCEEFQMLVEPENRLMGPAGLFNSATNLLMKLLKQNCYNAPRKDSKKYTKLNTGMALQVPWGKHNPVAWRLNHEAAQGGKEITQTDMLPIVMIKDPITWMASMCRHPYEARWRHVNEHCPNLVPNEHDKGRKPGEGSMAVKVKFASRHIGDAPSLDPKKNFIHFDSLVDLWNTWYNQYLNATFPRLMVRFEDLLFHAEETISHICACGGGTMKPKFRYIEDSAKGQVGPHKGSAGFLASLVTYGNYTLRMKDILTDERDREYARNHLDESLMELFGYAPI